MEYKGIVKHSLSSVVVIALISDVILQISDQTV